MSHSQNSLQRKVVKSFTYFKSTSKQDLCKLMSYFRICFTCSGLFLLACFVKKTVWDESRLIPTKQECNSISSAASLVSFPERNTDLYLLLSCSSSSIQYHTPLDWGVFLCLPSKQVPAMGTSYWCLCQTTKALNYLLDVVKLPILHNSI